MTTSPATGIGQADLDAARLLLARMGITPDDLLRAATPRPAVPTFADYIPIVSAVVSVGTRRVYGSYWNRILEHWAPRRLDEPRPSDIHQLVEHVKANSARLGLVCSSLPRRARLRTGSPSSSG